MQREADVRAEMQLLGQTEDGPLVSRECRLVHALCSARFLSALGKPDVDDLV